MIPTLRGALLLLAAAPAIAAGTWVPTLRWIAVVYVLLAAGLCLADWRLAGSIQRFQVSREHDLRLSLGAENPIRLRVHNLGSRSTPLWLRDEPPDAFEIDTRLLSGEIAGHGQWTEVYYVRPLRRGDYRFGNLNLRWRGPLRLIVRQGHVEAAAQVKVYPNMLDVRRYDLLVRRNQLKEFGLRHARFFGAGTEFERLREYLPDDDFRRIEWKATARRRRPVTIEYQTERSQNIIAVLDIGRMMQSPVARMAKLDYAVNAVLLLAFVASSKGDKVGLMAFADQVHVFQSPHQGRQQFYHMLEALYAVEAQPVEPDYHRALNYLALKQRKRSLVLLFTDISGGVSMQSLASSMTVLARRNLPLVVTVSDPEVHTAAHLQPHSSLEVYQRAAAVRVLEARKLVLDRLERQGVMTLDVPADRLTVAVINRYLELKGRMLL